MSTLRSRLTRTVLTIALPLWVAIGSVSWWSVLHELDEIYDAQMRDVVRPLGALSTPALIDDMQKVQEAALGVDDDPDFGVMVWDEAGALLYRSPGAPALHFSERLPSDRLASVGHVGGDDHHRVRWWHQPEHGRWMAVSIPLEERDELALAMGVGLALPLVVTALLLWPLMWWGVSRALAPLRTLVQSVRQRAGHDLSAIDVGDVPRDIEPLVEEVNALLERLREALTREQRFTADASHELRTPLAGAVAQLTVARGASSESDRQHALDKAADALQRATDLTGQLMLLARLDHHSGGVVPVPGWQDSIDLLGLCRDVVADEFESAHALGVGLALEPSGPSERLPPISGQPLWIRAALRNVVHNAVGHAPAGTEVLVCVQRLDDALWVSVQDQGPGLAPDVRAHLGQRFARAADTQGRTGSGLGLSIVRRVLDLHGGSWSFSEGPCLSVTLRWPLRRP